MSSAPALLLPPSEDPSLQRARGVPYVPPDLSHFSQQERVKLAQLLEVEHYRWSLHARPQQLPPGSQGASSPRADWRTWLIMAGRGFGKTRTGAEWVREQVKHYPLVNLIGPTADDARDAMIEGESGVLNVCPPAERPTYLPGRRLLVWPNGARSLVFTADVPDRLRGKQHMKLWCDEVAAWTYPESWTQAMLGLRLGSNPQVVATTTPRPTKMIRELYADPTTVVTGGDTYANRRNLAPDWFSGIISKYEGTRIGRQELNAELLLDVPGALWNIDMFNERRIPPPDMTSVVVGVDPSVSSGDDSDATGIIVAGKKGDQYYVFADRSLIGTPLQWGRAVISAFDTFHCDHITVEVNNGGDLVASNLHNIRHNLPIKLVHASRGKLTRAEPQATLYEQRRAWHTRGLDLLEDELCNYAPGVTQSPNRLDALVWALSDLSANERIAYAAY